MRILIVLLLATLCASAAETNAPIQLAIGTNTALLRRSIELSPAAARLNASPYFKSEVDDFKKCIWHKMTENTVEPLLAPVADFCAMVKYPEIGPAEHFLWVFLCADQASDWADMGTNHLAVIIDGVTTVSTESVPEKNYFRAAENLLGTRVYEANWYRVNADVLRAIASAKRVQFRIVGSRLNVQRSLDATNIARFKVFSKTFLDGR